MKRIAFAIAVGSLATLAGSGAAQVAPEGAHKLLTPDAVTWGAAPPSLPAGAQAAVLYGDPAKEGLFVLRLKMPAGYRVPPHSHPKSEIVTVVSGVVQLGMGTAVDDAKATRLPGGSFIALDPGMVHYAHAEEDAVIQLSSVGPWAINYVNKADDPRFK